MSTWSDCAERWALDAAALLLACVAAPLLLVALPALRLRIPYGRYASRSWGPGLPPRLAWVVQELPALAVPAWLICGESNPGDVYPGGPVVPWPNRVLLAMFIGHYFHRALIYPFLLRGGKPMPCVPFLLALAFCTFNGYLQGRTLLTCTRYPDGWLYDARFVAELHSVRQRSSIDPASSNCLARSQIGFLDFKRVRGGSSRGSALACWFADKPALGPHFAESTQAR
uniref:3-oxo-5-alpha-steroid 4-dehydrogenase 1 isoform X2 n=1 Tax=Petromyzon marinus TaxID=7757 RepID=A0AAJ7TGG5_PETMA|nr:3-oxo-5-alpha-steroid 4-dehydrogenase 1 isoform X2 [Petromyzon marinus]